MTTARAGGDGKSSSRPASKIYFLPSTGTANAGRLECRFTALPPPTLGSDGQISNTYSFHCLFCHGYEDRGASSVGVLAVEDCAPPGPAMHVANYALRLSQKVVIYTNGDTATTSAISSALSALKPDSKSRRNISINDKKITKFLKGRKGAEVEVVLENGEKKTEGFLAHKPVGRLNGGWVEQLGLETAPPGVIKVNFPFNETSVKGVFAVGDCATPMQAVAPAISMGGAAAAGVAASLEAED